MTDVMQFMIDSLTQLFNMLLSSGGQIGLAVVCIPLFIRMVRSLRSIISHK